MMLEDHYILYTEPANAVDKLLFFTTVLNFILVKNFILGQTAHIRSHFLHIFKIKRPTNTSTSQKDLLVHSKLQL